MPGLSSRVLGCMLTIVFSCPPPGPTDKMRETQEVPFQLVGGFLIEFEGTIGGLEGLRFILDTGATHSVVDRRIARKLGVPLRPAEVFDFDTNRVIAGEGVFPEVRFGPVILKDVDLFAANLGALSTFAENADAVVGMDLLGFGSFAIDYDQRRMFFQPVERSLSSVRLHDSAMCLQLRVQDHVMELLLDTGIEGLVLFEDRLRREIPNLVTEGKQKYIRLGPHTRAIQTTIPGIYLGTKEINQNVWLIKGPKSGALPGIYGYLGASALKPHRLEFDISGSHLRFQ